MTTDIIFYVGLGIVSITVFIVLRQNRKRSLPFPPGPKGLPLVGNIFDIPQGSEGEVFAKMSNALGSDILYLRALGQGILVLNSMKAIEDLFEKRSLIYSNRPQFAMLSELVGWKWAFGLMDYGDAWKERRRHFTQHFHTSNISIVEPYIIKSVHGMLQDLLERPEDFFSIVGHAVCGFSLSIAYGIPTKRVDDPNVELMEKAIASIGASVIPTRFLVNVFPALKYYPEFLPGGGFHTIAREWRKLQERFRHEPFSRATHDMRKGVSKPSYATTSLENLEDRHGMDSAFMVQQRELIKDNAAHILQGASETTSIVVRMIFVTMMLFPDTQKKAQQELDRVLKGRLPEFSDEPNLPMITAIIKEILRWKPLAPMSVPHVPTEDDIYRGYRIPKGTIVMPNMWKLLHDEQYFPNPDVFNPERYLKNGAIDPHIPLDPASFIFGFGRRACPGSHIGLAFFWLSLANILSAFDILPPEDNNGNPIEPHVEYKQGSLFEPLPFKCTIRPRFKESEYLIRSIEIDSHI